MKAIQLDLFTAKPTDYQIPEAKPSNCAPSRKNDGASAITNPCINCSLLEWCGADDCARKCYPTDVPTTRWKNLEEYIQFLKHYDWL